MQLECDSGNITYISSSYMVMMIFKSLSNDTTTRKNKLILTGDFLKLKQCILFSAIPTSGLSNCSQI